MTTKFYEDVEQAIKRHLPEAKVLNITLTAKDPFGTQVDCSIELDKLAIDKVESAFKDTRINSLMAANTELLERARKAERLIEPVSKPHSPTVIFHNATINITGDK